MVDIAEVVVRATPEGMGEVNDGLNEMEQNLSENTEQMDEQADALSDMSKKFQGAMAAVTAGFAIVTGTLLRRIPVLGETASAFGAILDAVALKMDSVLRPALNRVNNFLLDVAATIFEANGAFGTLIGVVGVVVTALLGIASAVLAGIAGFLALGGSLGTVTAAAGTLIAGIKALLVALGSLISLPAVIVAGLAILAFMFREEIYNAIQTAIAAFRDFVPKAMVAVRNVVKRVTEAFTSLVDKAKDWGKSLIEKLVKGIKSAAGAVQDIVEGINLTAGVTIGDVAGTAGELAGAASDAGSDFIGSVGSSAANVYLDGTRVDDNQGRYRKDALARRGG